MKKIDYEATLLWLGRVSLLLKNTSFNNKNISVKLSLASSQLDSAVRMLASQHQLWREASARLSGDAVDFAYFELQRAENALELENACEELIRLVKDALDDCPEFPL